MFGENEAQRITTPALEVPPKPLPEEPKLRWQALGETESVFSREDQEHMSREIAKVIAMPERYIDHGGAGIVYRLAERFCIKVIKGYANSPVEALINKGNAVGVEARFQHGFSGIEVAGCRVPLVYAYVEGEGANAAAIIMEELDATNLQHILNGKQAPAAFDPKKFMDSLGEFVLEFMHEKAEVVHGDLFARNVMVDNKTGMPRLIDFGRSAMLKKLSPEAKQAKIVAEQEQFDEIEAKILGLTNS